MRTRVLNRWAAASHVSLLYVLLINLLVGEEHPTPFHGSSGPDGKTCFYPFKMNPQKMNLCVPIFGLSPADIIFKSLFHRSLSMARIKLTVEAARTWSWSGIVGPATTPWKFGGWRSGVTTPRPTSLLLSAPIPFPGTTALGRRWVKSCSSQR